MAIFGSVFKDTIAPGVKFSQYFVAGMIASGMVNSGFQQLAIMIPMERDSGTLKRLRGTPMPLASYFIGKSILVLASMIIQTVLLVAGGVAAATALGGGGVAITNKSPAWVAPAWSANAFPLKKKTPQELAVEKALYKVGLLPKVAINTAWTSTHINALKAFQKGQQSPQTGIVDKSTYTALMKELP